MCEVKRSASLDAGNVKLTYNALLEKAESRDKERIKEENKKLRKLEGELRSVVVVGSLQLSLFRQFLEAYFAGRFSRRRMWRSTLSVRGEGPDRGQGGHHGRHGGAGGEDVQVRQPHSSRSFSDAISEISCKLYLTV